ncbi:MAG: caspase family protein [Pyrinomonadaceae bacterium]|nr:caspase family protein [Pyrinomonadaceae bacterium]
MIISPRPRNRLKLGRCESFEQALWRSDDRPHVIVDARARPHRCADVAWSPDDRMIAAATTGGVKVWTLGPTAEMRTFLVEGSGATLSAFSGDGRLLASASGEGRLAVWELASGRRLWSVLAHSKGFASLKFNPASDAVISVGLDGAVKIWSVSPGKLLRAVPVPKLSVDGCAVSADGRLVALGGDGGVTLLDTRRGAQRRGDIPGDVWVNSAVFAAEGAILATGGSDGVVRLWSTGTAKLLRKISRPFGQSVPGKRGRSILRRSADGRPSAGEAGRSGPDLVLSLAFGCDDSLLAGGTVGGGVAVWKAKSGSLLHFTNAHTYYVTGVAFSHDGSMLATSGGLDRIVKIWDVGRKLEELVTLIALGDDQWAAVTPDDRFDASSGGLEYIHWAFGTRAPVPVKQVPEQPPDPTILPSVGQRRARGRTRTRTPRTSLTSFPKQPEPPVSSEEGSRKPVLTVRTRPSHRLRSVAWNEDSTILAGGTEDGNIDIWDRATGRELRTLRGHDDTITSLIFAGPDILASGARDSTVRLWNIRTGELLHTFLVGLPDTGVSIASAVADGLLICASYEGTIRWLHLGQRTCVNTARILFEEDGMTSLLSELVIVSPDGRMAIRPYDRYTVAAFDLPAQKLRYEFHSDDTPGGIAFDKNGKRFAVGGATTRQMIILGGRQGKGAAEHPLETYAVDVRRTEDGTRVQSHLGHHRNVVALAFRPDGASLATGAWEGTVRVWGKNTRKEQQRLETRFDAVPAVAYNRDGSLLATGEARGHFDGRISVWDTASGKRVQTFERHIGDVHPVRFSPDGTLLAAAGEDGILRLWRLRLRTPPTLIKGHTGRIFSLAFSPDGQYIATASWDGTSRLWRTDTGELVWMLDSRATVRVWSVAFNPDGLSLATGCDDGSVRVWDIATGEQLRTMEGGPPAHDEAVFGLAFSPDGELLATGAMDHRIVLWDISTGKARRVIAHDAWVSSLDFNNDGTILAAGDLDQEICLWDLETRKARRRLSGHAKPGHIEKGTSVRFSRDGTLLASGGTDGTLRLWDPAAGKQLAVVHGHSGPVASVDLNATNTLLAAGSNDASASIWDLRDPMAPAKICNLYSFPDGTWAVVDARGRFDAANGGDIPWLHWVVGLETVALSQLKERYYEPNLLPKLMGADAEPLRDVPSLQEVELHPDVELLAVESGGKRARIRLTNRGGGIGRVVVSINGKEANADARGEDPDVLAPELEMSIDVAKHPFLKPGKNVCEVRAYNAAGYLVGRQLRWVCPGPRKSTEAPRLWGVVAGVSDYQGDKLDLRFAAKDAADFAAAVRVGAARLFGADRVHLRLLVAPHRPSATESDQSVAPGRSANSEEQWPTRQNLLRAFEEARAAKSADVLIVYLAGHGVNQGGQDGDYYYLTADARTGDLADPAVRQQTAISSRELTEWIRLIPALKQAVILDTCAAGRFVETLSEHRTIPSSQARALERLTDRMGTYILAGSAADAVSYESSRYGQGLLTYSVLFGMRGAALRDEEFVDIARLFEHAADYVPQLATDLGGIQRPLIASPAGGSSFDIGWLERTDRERIPLAIIRPLVLGVQLEEETTWKDSLEVTRAVNAILREESARPEASVIFIDAREHPDAYQLRGRYRIEGDRVTMALKLFWREEMVSSFEQSGRRSGVDALARELATHTIGLVVEQFNQE